MAANPGAFCAQLTGRFCQRISGTGHERESEQLLKKLGGLNPYGCRGVFLIEPRIVRGSI
jgi:hypothetical protein